MKFDNIVLSPVHTEGVQQQAAFTVEFGPHLMMLLSKLYSDIHWAIVREYGTNMLDAYAHMPTHREFRPPIIHLPNLLEPFIEFKDFGVGMPFDVAWNTFRTYGASTKRNNNEEVGGLGLGCKSAFAYEHIDPWTVESRYNGELMIFTAHRAEDGTPTFVHISTLPTTEENGVTIRIPLNERDFRKIKDAVRRLLQYYPLEVIVTGDPDFTFTKPEYVLRGTGWGMNKSAKYGGSNWQVIMGNVNYPCDTSQVFKVPDMGFDLDLYLPIGSANIVPSREALEYTDNTINVIKEAYERVLTEVRDLTSQHIRNAPTYWDALISMKESFGIPRLRDLISKVEWKNRKINATGGITVPIAALMRRFPQIKVIERYKTERGRTFNFKFTDTTEVGSMKQITVTPYDQSLREIFVDHRPMDKRRGTKVAIREWLRERVATNNGYGRARWYTQQDASVYVMVVDAPLDPAEVKRFIRGFPVADFETILPEIKEKEKVFRTREKVKVERWSGHSFTPDASVDPDDEVTYYFIRKQRNDYELSNHQITQLWSLALKEGYVGPNDKLYAVPRTLQRLEKKENWVEFKTFMAAKVAKKWAKVKKKAYLRDLYETCVGNNTFKALSRYDPLRLPKEIRNLIRKVTAVKDVHSEVEQWLAYAQMLNLDGLVKRDSNEWSDMLSRYPMLNIIAEQYNAFTVIVSNKETISEYLLQREREIAEVEQVTVQLTA